jgi:hypothetical protein
MAVTTEERPLHTPSASATQANLRGKPASPSRRWLRRGVFLLYVLLLGELAARSWWSLCYGVPFFDTAQIQSHRFYGELHRSGVLTTAVTKADAYYDVLLLGGSAVSPDFTDIDQRLRRDLETLTERPVRVFNCACPAMTLRDSLLKYQALADQQFDLVVVYDGINDARLNNCPPGRFRDDYTHSAWYYRIQALGHHPELSWFVLPYTVEHALVSTMDSQLATRLFPERAFVSRHAPKNWQWATQTQELKTPAPYRRNLLDLVELAARREAKVLLIGYAWHIPEDYTIEKFQARQLDYSPGAGMPVESIGTPDAVRAACAAHNAASREIAERFEHVLYVDQQELLPKRGEFFYDCCHLTAAGSQRFVDNLRQPLRDWLPPASAPAVMAERTR